MIIVGNVKTKKDATEIIQIMKIAATGQRARILGRRA